MEPEKSETMHTAPLNSTLQCSVLNVVAAVHKVTQKLNFLSPDSPFFLLDFSSHCDLKSINNFYQYTSYLHILTKTIDSVSLPTLDSLDHNTIIDDSMVMFWLQSRK